MSESWASTLLQTAVGLLVFGLGLWAYLMPFGIEQEIKTVVHKNRILISWKLGLAAIIYIISILMLMLFPFGISERVIVFDLRVSHLIIALIMIGFLTTLWFWLSTSRPPTLERVIHVLTSRTKKSPARPLVASMAIDDLISIGRASTVSHDARSVLKGLRELATVVQKRSSYRGNDLESLIQGVYLIVLSEKQGYLDEHLAIQGSTILEGIVSNATTRGMEGGADARRAVQALGMITKRALYSNPGLIASMLVERLGRASIADASFALLEVGQEALHRDRFFVAMAALRFLERSHGEARKQQISNACLLGLVAFWWARDGECRDEAVACIKRIASTGVYLSAEIASAISLFSDRLDYGTVKFLRHLDREIAM